MGRAELKYVGVQDFSGGINVNEPLARPNELRDALNVWVHEGVCQGRPGLHPVILRDAATGGTGKAHAGDDFFAEDTATGNFLANVLGVLTLTAAYVQVGDRIYINCGATLDNSMMIIMTGSYAGATPDFGLEYYNGSNWGGIDVIRTSTYAYNFLLPLDSCSTTVNGTTGHLLRFVFHTAATAGDTLNDYTVYYIENTLYRTALFSYEPALTGLLTRFAASYTKLYVIPPGYGATEYSVSFPSLGKPPYHSCATVNNLNDDVYLSFEKMLFEWNPQIPRLQRLAVETDPLFVGVAGVANDGTVDYHVDEIAQFGEFPRAGLIKFFGAKIWLSQIEGEPGVVRWTAPFPAHHVLPRINYEYCTGDDPSEPQAFGTLGENLVVIKGNSFWNVIYAGDDALTGSLESYQMVKQVTGAGTRSAGSVQEIAGRIFCLGEAQVYEYDGQRARNVGEKIHKQLLRINKGLPQVVSSCYWEDFGLYMLAVPLDGSTHNSHILVYDINTVDDKGIGAWWIWQLPGSIEPVKLQVIDSKCYVLDQYGFMYEFCGRASDNGAAITAWVETHDQLRNDTMTKEVREVRVVCSNDVDTVTATVTPNDRVVATTSAPIVITDVNDGLFSNWVTSEMPLATQDFREKHVGVRETFRRIRVRVTSAVKNQRMFIQSVLLGYTTKGRR